MSRWIIEWNNGDKQIVESDGEPDTDAIESGEDADSPCWGCSIKSVTEEVNDID